MTTVQAINIPTASEAECRILGGALRSVNWVNVLCEHLTALHFYDSRNREIFARIKDLYENDQDVAFDKIEPKIDRKTCPLNHLVDVYALASLGIDPQELISELKEAFLKRRFQEIGHEFIKQAATSRKPDEILRAIEEELFSITQGISAKSLRTVREILEKPKPFLEFLQERQEAYQLGEQAFVGFPTHFIDLDKKIKGLIPGHLTIIGARPGIGKTSFALNLIEKLSLQSNIPCLLFSMEMPATEIVNKLVCQTAQVPFQKFADGSVDGSDYQLLVSASKAWGNKTLIIDDQPSLGIDQIKSRAIRSKRSHNIQAIFIDYVQLITTSRKHDQRHLEIGEISRKLKEIAKELNVPVIALAQLNRELEKRTDKTPFLSDLRESGSLEADADEILLLHRPELYKQGERPGLMQVHLSKNRFGPTGMFELIFAKETGELKNYAAKH